MLFENNLLYHFGYVLEREIILVLNIFLNRFVQKEAILSIRYDN